MNETPQQNQEHQSHPQANLQPSVPPPSPHSQPPSRVKGGFSSSPYLYALLMFVVGIGVGYVLIQQFPGNKMAENTKPAQNAAVIVLPKDAVKVKDCVDKKGQLSIDPKDIPQGPIYMTDKNKVIGLEYVFSEDEFKTGKTVDVLSALDSKVNHLSVTTLADGYEGKPGVFYVIDLYLVKKEAKDAIICPDATPTPLTASPSAGLSTTPEPTVKVSPKLTPKISPTEVSSPSALRN